MTLNPQMVERFTLYSLAVTAACLPLYVVRWHLGPLPSTLLEVLIAITAVGYVTTLWAQKRLPAAHTFLDIPIVLLLVAGLIAIAVAPNHAAALGIYRAYFLEAIVSFYIAVDLLRTRDDTVTFLRVAAVGSCVMAVGQIVSFVFVAAQNHLELTGAPAFLNTSPNPVALYLEPPLAFAVAFSLFPSRPRERWFGIGVLVLLLVATILTLSRASYIAMAALALVLVLSLQSARWRLRAIAILSLLGLVTLEVPFVNQRLLDLARSVTVRSSLYHQALEMLAQRPILGAGISGFPVRVAPFRPPTQVVQLYPHDLWLTTWSELGLLGLMAFAIIFFSLLWRGVRALPRTTDIYRPMMWGAVGALILYLVHGLFDSPYWKNDLSVEFWLLAALLVIAARSTASPSISAKRQGTSTSTGSPPEH
jgi:O-antigen ligase